jgi:hypothetical protein
MSIDTTYGARLTIVFTYCFPVVRSQEPGNKPSSCAPVDIHETFAAIMNRITVAKPEIMRCQMALLQQRYDLSDRSANGDVSGQAAARRRSGDTASGITWDQLAKLTPEEIQERGCSPRVSCLLHPEGGMVFP